MDETAAFPLTFQRHPLWKAERAGHSCGSFSSLERTLPKPAMLKTSAFRAKRRCSPNLKILKLPQAEPLCDSVQEPVKMGKCARRHATSLCASNCRENDTETVTSTPVELASKQVGSVMVLQALKNSYRPIAGLPEDSLDDPLIRAESTTGDAIEMRSRCTVGDSPKIA